MASSLCRRGIKRQAVVSRKRVVPLPSLDPGHVSPQRGTEVDGCWMQRQTGGRCPEFELVAVTAATMAVVAADCQIHREARLFARGAPRQRTASVPLITSVTGGFEVEQLEYLLDTDFHTQPVEVDAGHDVDLVGA